MFTLQYIGVRIQKTFMGASVGKRTRPKQVELVGWETRSTNLCDGTALSQRQNSIVADRELANQHQQLTIEESYPASSDAADADSEPISHTRVSAIRLSGNRFVNEDDHYDEINDSAKSGIHIYDYIKECTDDTDTEIQSRSNVNGLDEHCSTEDSTAKSKEREGEDTIEIRERRRCKYYEYMVNVFRPLIVKNLIVHDVLPHLTFLEDEWRIFAAEQRSPQQAVMYLLEEMEKSKEVRKWKRFMTALEQSGYEYIVQNIRGTQAIDNTYQVYYLRTLRPKLSQMIEPRELLPRLCAEAIITDNTRQEIEQEETNHGRISAALLLLDRIPRKGTFWYPKFVQVLRDENMDEVADNLDIPEVVNCTHQSFRPAIEPHSPDQTSGITVEPHFPRMSLSSLHFSDFENTATESKMETSEIVDTGILHPKPRHISKESLRESYEWTDHTSLNTRLKNAEIPEREVIGNVSFELQEYPETTKSNSIDAVSLLLEIRREVKTINTSLFSLRQSVMEIQRDIPILKEQNQRLTEEVSKLRLRSISEETFVSAENNWKKINTKANFG